MSDDQWAGVVKGDEAYAGGRSYFRLLEAGRDIFGYEYIQPVHQGRAAEKVLFSLLMGPQKVCISNMFFDTTRAHVEIAGARAIDCIVKEAEDVSTKYPFKGNMDVEKLEELINEYGKEGCLGGNGISPTTLQAASLFPEKYERSISGMQKI